MRLAGVGVNVACDGIVAAAVRLEQLATVAIGKIVCPRLPGVVRAHGPVLAGVRLGQWTERPWQGVPQLFAFLTKNQKISMSPL